MIDEPDYERILDEKYEALRGDALLDAPVDAIAGITPAHTEMLRAALGIATIRDLATHRHVRLAQRLAQAAAPRPELAEERVAGPGRREGLEHALQQSMAALRDQLAVIGARLHGAAEHERRTDHELRGLGECQRRLLAALQSPAHAQAGRSEAGLVLERLGAIERELRATHDLTARLDRRSSESQPRPATRGST